MERDIAELQLKKYKTYSQAVLKVMRAVGAVGLMPSLREAKIENGTSVTKKVPEKMDNFKRSFMSSLMSARASFSLSELLRFDSTDWGEAGMLLMGVTSA